MLIAKCMNPSILQKKIRSFTREVASYFEDLKMLTFGFRELGWYKLYISNIVSMMPEYSQAHYDVKISRKHKKPILQEA